MPASGKVLLDDLRQLVLGQDLVDAVLLAPDQRRRQHLARLLHVEVPRAQEAEQDGVAGNFALEIKIGMLLLVVRLNCRINPETKNSKEVVTY